MVAVPPLPLFTGPPANTGRYHISKEANNYSVKFALLFIY